MKKIVKNTLLLSFGQGLSLFIGAFSTLIYGVVFSKPQIAVISLFEMITQLFFSFGFKWSTVGIIRFGKEEFLEKNKINYTSSVRLILIMPILLISVILILCYQNTISDYMGMKDNSLIGYLILGLFVSIINEHITTLLNTAEEYAGILFLNVTESLGRCILLAILIIYNLNISAEYYIKLMVYWPIVLFFLRIPFLKKEYLFPIKFVLIKDVIRFFKFVYPQIYGFAGLYLINWMDIYFIRRYLSMEDLGGYQFIYSIFVRICTFAFIFNNIFFPKIMTWKKSANRLKLNQYLRKIPFLVLMTSFAAVLAMIFIYPPVFKYFFKNKFIQAYPAFNVLLISIPFFMATYLYVPVLNCYDKVKWIQITNLISALANFLVDYFFIRYYGIIAAAFGTFLCYFLKYILLMTYVSRLKKQNGLSG